MYLSGLGFRWGVFDRPRPGHVLSAQQADSENPQNQTSRMHNTSPSEEARFKPAAPKTSAQPTFYTVCACCDTVYFNNDMQARFSHRGRLVATTDGTITRASSRSVYFGLKNLAFSRPVDLMAYF